MLINMGDANELSAKLNSKITYRAYKGAVILLFKLKINSIKYIIFTF